MEKFNNYEIKTEAVTIECMRNRVFALSICAFVRSSAESAFLTCALKRQIRLRLQI